MVPLRHLCPSGLIGAPRASGDGPDEQTSPVSPVRVLPSRAGMVRVHLLGCGHVLRAPRASGDGPPRRLVCLRSGVCSPRERGWSQTGLPTDLHVAVLPARAGMVPAAGPRRPRRSRAPRASGDGPRHHLTTSTGSGCSPRERGWSQLDLHPAYLLACSPRERGWSRRRDRGSVLPARAGMVPARDVPTGCRPCSPRASGDGPTADVAIAVRPWCSPRERGWSRGLSYLRGTIRVVPARAGMILPRLAVHGWRRCDPFASARDRQ